MKIVWLFRLAWKGEKGALETVLEAIREQGDSILDVRTDPVED